MKRCFGVEGRGRAVYEYVVQIAVNLREQGAASIAHEVFPTLGGLVTTAVLAQLNAILMAWGGKFTLLLAPLGLPFWLPALDIFENRGPYWI